MLKVFSENINFFLDLIRIITSEIFGFLRFFGFKNPNLKRLFKLEERAEAKRLLIVSLTNTNFSINIESLFAKYFNLEGYKVFFLTNFKYKKAVKTFRAIEGKTIYHHFIYLKKGIKSLFKRLPVVSDPQGVKNFCYKNINIGIGVYSTLSRKLRLGKLDFSDKKTKRLANRYLRRSAVYLEAAKEILGRTKPDLILALEKGYMGHSEIFNLAVEQGIDFIQWCGCQEVNALIFKRYNKQNKREPPFSVSSKTWNRFLSLPWNEKYRKEVYEAFDRGYLKQDWFWYKDLSGISKFISKEELIKKYNLNPEKKIAILFSHVLWDANLFYGKDLFEQGFEEWLIESIKVMVKNKNINWLIKIHQANKIKFFLEKTKDEYRENKAIKENFGEIPENIKIIYPEDEINPYSLFKIIDYGITVRGTIGTELPCLGLPVLTAGTGRYSGRGFTIDSSQKSEYLEKLAHLEDFPKLKEEQIRLAILHTYILFKLRPLKFSSFEDKRSSKGNDIGINIESPEQGEDFLRFVNWASKTKEEDFLIT